MITNILILCAGLVIGVFITQLSEIKSTIKRRGNIKRYNKLLSGTPKHVVHIECFDDIYKYRKYPFYINGQVLGVSGFSFWHCNDEGQWLVDKDGKKKGFLTSDIVRSKRLAKDRWRHYRALVLKENPNFLGEKISVSAVLAVY